MAVSCFSQTTLQQYLNLTPQQVTAFQNLNSTYQSYASVQQGQTSQLTQAIQHLYASPPPDPAQLGTLYLSLEQVRRDIQTHLTALQQQSLALLTASQSSQLTMLNTALDLQPLVSDAQCAFLVDATPGNAFASFLLGTPTYGTVYFSNPFASGTAILSTVATSFCNFNTFPASVRLYLNLSDTQIAAIYAATATYNDQYTRAQDQIADIQVYIRDQTAAASPNPSALGAAYAQLAAVNQQIQTYQSQRNQTARATLTTAQASQLQVMQNAANLQPVVTQAEACSLLVPTPNPGTNPVLQYGPCLP